MINTNIINIAKLLLLLIIAGNLSACSLMYNSYYSNMKVEVKKLKKTKSLTTYDLSDQNIDYFTKNGYLLVGKSSFRSVFQGQNYAINAGRAIGAEVMLYKYNYVGTSKGVATIPYYIPGNTYLITTNYSGRSNSNTNSRYSYNNGYGYGTSTSNSSYNGNSTTQITEPGTYAYTNVPYSYDYYDQFAVYYKKMLFRVNDDSVWLYEKQNVNDNIFTMVHKNQWFRLIKKGKNFNQIEYKGIVGFISSKHKMF